jgi:hypothetical protein
MRGRAAAAEVEEDGVEAVTEETGSSGVDDSGGDRRSTERRGLIEFWDENERRQGGLLFIYLKILATVLN